MRLPESAVLALVLAVAAVIAAGCYTGPETQDEGPPRLGSGAPIIEENFLHQGERQPRRESVRVRDPISAGSVVTVRIRNLGNPTTGNIDPAVLNLGAGLSNSITMPSNAGAYTLFMRSDSTLATTPDPGGLTSLPIPAGGDTALEFTGSVPTLILSGIWRYELNLTTAGGISNILFSIDAES